MCAGVHASDVDDLKQEIMQVLIAELPKFEHNGRKGAFRTWLRNVVANRLRAYRHSPARRQQATGGSDYARFAKILADPHSDMSQAWEQEYNQHVLQCLMDSVSARFSEKTMTAFRQTFLADRSVDDVAQDLHMTVNAVVLARSRVLRALRQSGEGLIE